MLDDFSGDLHEINKGGSSTMNFRELINLVLVPLSLPLAFMQEVLDFIKEKAGFKRRTLEGKVVVITGASSGIGETLAQLFYLSGCRLILVSRRKVELERVRDGLVRSKTVGNVHVPAIVEMDISNFESIPEKCKQMIEIWGFVDILVNNAGMSFRGEILHTDLHVHQQLMNVNYFGAVELIKHIADSMVERKSGQIVFINSIQGKISVPFRSAYAASKHALIAYADSLRAELSQHGIPVTSICPGYVKTNISLNALTGSGEVHGMMDEATEQGYSTEFVSKRILRAIVNEEKELLIAPYIHKFAILLRILLPTLFFFIMMRRAKKGQ